MATEFDTAWQGQEIGNWMLVSNGEQPPSKIGGPRWRQWRSHNFIGRLVEKRDEEPRKMVFRLPRHNGALVSYDICERVGHQFEASDEEAAEAAVASFI